MKSLLQQVSPPVLWNLARRARSMLCPPTVEPVDPAKVVLETEFRDANAPLDEDVIQLRPQLAFGIHPESRYAFEHFCFRSLEMVAELNCFISETARCQRLLDVGALHGIFSLAFTKDRPDASALAVDASPLAFSRLLYNLHKNPTCTIVPVECALSDRVGRLSMHYEWEHAVAAGSAGARLFQVPMTTGDKLCETKTFMPDAVKIDVEGHEVKVIRGLEQTITRRRPAIFLEVHPARIAQEGDSLAWIADFLGGLGYRARTVSGQFFELSALSSLRADERLVLLT